MDDIEVHNVIDQTLHSFVFTLISKQTIQVRDIARFRSGEKTAVLEDFRDAWCTALQDKLQGDQRNLPFLTPTAAVPFVTPRTTPRTGALSSVRRGRLPHVSSAHVADPIESDRPVPDAFDPLSRRSVVEELVYAEQVEVEDNTPKHNAARYKPLQSDSDGESDLFAGLDSDSSDAFGDSNDESESAEKNPGSDAGANQETENKQSEEPAELPFAERVSTALHTVPKDQQLAAARWEVLLRGASVGRDGLTDEERGYLADLDGPVDEGEKAMQELFFSRAAKMRSAIRALGGEREGQDFVVGLAASTLRLEKSANNTARLFREGDSSVPAIHHAILSVGGRIDVASHVYLRNNAMDSPMELDK